MILNGGHLVKWLHWWGRKMQLCSLSYKFALVGLSSVMYIIYIYTGSIQSTKDWNWLVIHTLANIAWWRPCWKMANTVENTLIFVKTSPMVFYRSDRWHEPKISTFMNWKWTLSLALGTHYCRMAAILKNGCHGMKILSDIILLECSPWCFWQRFDWIFGD